MTIPLWLTRWETFFLVCEATEATDANTTNTGGFILQKIEQKDCRILEGHFMSPLEQHLPHVIPPEVKTAKWVKYSERYTRCLVYQLIRCARVLVNFPAILSGSRWFCRASGAGLWSQLYFIWREQGIMYVQTCKSDTSVAARGWSKTDLRRRDLFQQTNQCCFQGFGRRRTLLARPLVKEYGIGSILLENPFCILSAGWFANFEEINWFCSRCTSCFVMCFSF